MSTAEEDVEFRDLLVQILEKNGCFAKLRAELRATTFLALDEDIKLSKQHPLQNLLVQTYLETPEGRAMFFLVREFLEFFNLQCTISVYESEAYLDSINQYEGRQKLAKDLGLGLDNVEESTVPLLQQLLKIAQTKTKTLDINLNMNNDYNGSLKGDSLDNNSSNQKTESCNSTRISDIYEFYQGNDNLNATFNVVHSSSIADKTQFLPSQNGEIPEPLKEIPEQEKSHISIEKNGVPLGEYKNDASIIVPKFLKDIKEDDTYEDTSSIAEDSEGLEKATSESKISENSVPSKLKGESIQKSVNLKKPDSEKPKLSPQRNKACLSSLSDLPPLPVNKTRVSNDILPSLYSKDLKNKSPLKELDKMFDMEMEYEEDFMYSNEISVNSSQKNSLDESSKVNNADLDILNVKSRKNSNKIRPEVAKNVQNNNCSNSLKTDDHINNSSISEHTVSQAINSAHN